MALNLTSRQLFDELSQSGHGGTGVHAVQSHDGITLTLYVNGSTVTFLAEILPLRNDPEDDKLLRKMLAYAFPGLRLRGGALTINSEENNLVFSYEQNLTMLTKTRFESLLANFAETATELCLAAQRLRLG
ncbi:CesT family type III secretion system chaperone [Brenneria rubrifaciens]|uniref:Type III chaperone ShcV n=1 Tax=Brenneria rubrifaciens TaxID=55213 RepID=A0A4P8QKJ0_9GAMM|nr:CesT family type III secretion system chaperone [Brenneria rubrifaciens]QCR07371.1 type III chaperone ShcV [Brenneria rubrifaciens]